MSGPKPTPALTPAQIQATEDREAMIRQSRPVLPSTSITPARCDTCGHWNARENVACRDCGLPFVARAA